MADSSDGAIKEVGAYFSKDSTFSMNSYYIPVVPQIESDSFLSDSSGWMLVSGEFVAQGGEKFITIGNFKNDANTNTMDFPCQKPLGGTCFIYYYIDDVSVYCCDSKGCGGVGINEQLIVDNGKLRVYPNPAEGSFKLEILNFEIRKSGNKDL